MTFVAGQILTAAQMNDLEAKTVPVGVINPFAGVTAPSGWLLCNGSDVSRSTYSGLFAIFASTFTTATTTNSSTTVSGLSGMSSTTHVGWGIAGTNIPSGATISSVTNATTVVISASATGTATGTANIAISPYRFTGAGNTTTFLLPDLRSRFIAGKGTGTWSDILAETGGTADAINVSHTHGFAGYPSDQEAVNYGLQYQSGGLNIGFIDRVYVDATTSQSGYIYSAGSSGTNQNLPPYLTLNFIIKT